MNCADFESLLDAYVDEELGPPHAQAVEAHLAECAACRAQLANRTELRASLRAHVQRHTAPEQLAERIMAALPAAAAESPAAARGKVPATPRPRRPVRSRLFGAELDGVSDGRGFASSARALRGASLASLALGALCLAAAVAAITWTLTLHFAVPDPADRLIDELAASHTRALMVDHAMDVASTDQHTVKPWFSGKLDFSPDVEDLASADFPLLGGRLDYVAGRPVPALVYRHRKHLIDVFVFPEGHEPELSMASRNGYNFVHWSRGGLAYWAVSELNARELAEFRSLFLTAAGS